MKIVNAIWEKRNLGISCQEITLELNDSIESLQILDSPVSDYQVIRLPVERPDLILPIQSYGFNFIEIIYQSSHDLEEPDLNKLTKRIADEFNIQIANEFDIDRVKIKISEGIFKTDRIAIDSNFDIRDSSNRYIGWLIDELNSGSILFELLRQNTPVGFFLMAKKGNICDARIGGLYLNSNNLGLGLILGYYEIIAARSLGCKKLIANFSSNNLSVFQMNDLLGHKIRPLFNVFIKHN